MNTRDKQSEMRSSRSLGDLKGSLLKGNERVRKHSTGESGDTHSHTTLIHNESVIKHQTAPPLASHPESIPIGRSERQEDVNNEAVSREKKSLTSADTSARIKCFHTGWRVRGREREKVKSFTCTARHPVSLSMIHNNLRCHQNC